MIKSCIALSCLLATCFDVEPDSGTGAGAEPLPETVFFSIDIRPLFEASCIQCHGGAGGLDLESYEGVITGGNTGAVVDPGVPENSLLVHRLDGSVPPVMPLDAPPFPQPDIDRIAQWILEGAKDN